MQRVKKSKEVKSVVNPNPQTYITSVSDIFLHPTELLYIIVDSQNRLRMFDLPTMSLIGKSYIKIEDGYSIYKCMFTKDDFGLFYTLCRKEYPEEEPQPEPDPKDSHASNHKIKRYNYILNVHYLNKKGQILCSACEVNLNDTEDKLDIEQKLEVDIQKMGASHRTQCLTNYQKMQKEREKFIQEYYSQQHNAKTQSEAVNTNCQPPQPMQLAIGEIIEQEHEYSDREEDQMERTQKRDNPKSNIPAREIEEEPRQGHLEGTYYYLKLYTQILEISSYAETSKSQSNSIHKNIHFTLLCNDGFHLCSLDRKIKEISFDATQIVVGANIYGNIDSFSLDPLFSQTHHEGQTGIQFGDIWIVFSASSCYLVEVGDNWSRRDATMEEEQSKQFITYSKLPFVLDPRHYQTSEPENQVKFSVDTSNKLVLDCPKKLCLVMALQGCISLISYEKLSLQVIAKIKLDTFHWSLGTQPKLPSLINFLAIGRFGVNTSTTNKYQSKVMILVGVPNVNLDEREKQKEGQKEKEKDTVGMGMEDEARDFEKQKEKEKQKRSEKIKEKQKSSNIVYIYSVDLRNEFATPQTPNVLPSFMSTMKPLETTEQLVTVLRDFPMVRKIWYCEYVQNRINFVNQENQVQMVELCRFLEGKHMGKQWVNLGYRFEALEVNELYEQLEDEFELTAEQNGIGVNGVREKLNQLNDWSYSCLPRDVILNKKIKKLNCVDL